MTFAGHYRHRHTITGSTPATPCLILYRQLKGSMQSVLIPRAILLAIVSTGLLFPTWWQPVVSGLYYGLCRWTLYHASFFETVLTILCYITIEPIYTARFARHHDRRIDVRPDTTATTADKTPGRRRLPKMKRPSHRLRELLIYAAPLLLLDLTMVKKYAGVDVAAIRRSGGHSAERALHVHGSFLAPSLHNISWQSPLQLVRALPGDAPSSRRVLVELAASLVLYDAFFFAIHLAFHRVPALQRIHGPHHGHHEIHPQVTNQLTVTERVALILLANFALNIIGGHVLTRTLFVPVFLYLLIEVHSGVELDWQYDKILPQGWGAGTRKHAAHHREGKRFYQPFFCWWDDWLEWWEESKVS
jgi:cholesterol 25-hydroxylase